MKSPYWILALILVIGGLWLTRSKVQTPEAQEKKKAAGVSTDADAQNFNVVGAESPKLESASKGQIAKQMKAQAARRQAGFQKLPFTMKGDSWEVPVELRTSLKKCELGDLDLIRVDQIRRKINSVILSLEDMSTRTSLVQKDINLNNIPQTIVLKWKGTDKHRALGLYICSDAKGSKSCSQAKVSPINTAVTNDKGAIAGDKVYYFQFLQEGKQLELLDVSRPKSKDKGMLKSALAQDDQGEINAASLSETVSDNLKAVGSMAARTDMNKLIIDLPRNDPACPLPHLTF